VSPQNSSAAVDEKAEQALKPVETTLPAGQTSNKFTTARASHILVDGEAICKEVPLVTVAHILHVEVVS